MDTERRRHGHEAVAVENGGGGKSVWVGVGGQEEAARLGMSTSLPESRTSRTVLRMKSEPAAVIEIR